MRLTMQGYFTPKKYILFLFHLYIIIVSIYLKKNNLQNLEIFKLATILHETIK